MTRISASSACRSRPARPRHRRRRRRPWCRPSTTTLPARCRPCPSPASFPAGADRLTNANRQQLLTNGIATIFASQIGASAWSAPSPPIAPTAPATPIAYLDAETPLTLMKLTRDLA